VAYYLDIVAEDMDMMKCHLMGDMEYSVMDKHYLEGMGALAGSEEDRGLVLGKGGRNCPGEDRGTDRLFLEEVGEQKLWVG